MNKKDKLFEEARDALFLIEKGNEVILNKAARLLKQTVYFSFEKVMEVATENGCVLHPTMERCMNCETKEVFDQGAFPLVLDRKDGQVEHFSGSYTLLNQTVSLLSLRRLVIRDRLQQVMQHKRLIDCVNQVHENERRAFSQELHDGLAQSIYSIMLETRQLKRMDSSADVLGKIQTIDDNLGSLLNEVKQLAVDLRLSVLDDLGLVPAIETLLNRLTGTTGVTIHFISTITEKRFSDKIATTIYRVLQESVMNSIKHAGMEEVWVTLKEQQSQLLLTVRDQGRGFDLSSVQATSSGVGLYHMQERAESIGGCLHIQSNKSVGTSISLQLPINEELEI